MKIKIIAVGKIKERFTQQWIDEFLKRIQKWSRIEITEIKECGKKEESMKIEQKLKASDFNVLMDVRGEQVSSENFSALIKEKSLVGDIVFVLGGAEGISEIKGIHKKISFSRMTFTHQIARLLLLEQIYRGLTIIKRTRYHK